MSYKLYDTYTENDAILNSEVYNFVYDLNEKYNINVREFIVMLAH